MKATVSGVVEDLKFKISEGSDQNRCFLDSAHLAVSAKLRQLSGQKTMTEAEHNRPIPKLFNNRPSALASEVFGLLIGY